jgi:hypothetical protein
MLAIAASGLGGASAKAAPAAATAEPVEAGPLRGLETAKATVEAEISRASSAAGEASGGGAPTGSAEPPSGASVPEQAAPTEAPPTAITEPPAETAIQPPAASLSSESPTCNLYASVNGNNAGSGSAAAPLRTISALLARLRPGQTGCLASGQTFNENVSITDANSHGAPGEPVTLTSVEPLTPARINGRVVTETGADWLTFSHLDFTFSQHSPPSITVGSIHTSWIYDDITAPKTTCFDLISSPTWGVARRTLIEHDRIHGCGAQETFLCNQNIPLCETPPNDGFFIHGLYIGGGRTTTVRNNYFYGNADRAVQMRSGAAGVVVEHNIMDGNGEGIIFGDGAGNAKVQWNIITNSRSRCGELTGCYDYGASEYRAGLSNLLAHNDVYGNQCALATPRCWPNVGNIESMDRVTVEQNIEVNPLYVNSAAGNYSLKAGSPALGYGPDTAQPGYTP